MATSGSKLTSCVINLTASEDGTDVNTEFIDPDSDCREKPSSEEGQNIWSKESFSVQIQVQLVAASTNYVRLKGRHFRLLPSLVECHFLTAQMLTAVKWMKWNMP